MPDTEGANAAEQPEWRKQLMIEQIKECWADNRNFDVILWAIPATISGIAGLLLNSIFQINSSTYAIWARPFLALAAAVFTLPLVVALFKNRLFQIDRNNWRNALYCALENGTLPTVELERIRYSPEPRSNAVTFSTPRLTSETNHGSKYWRILAGRFQSIRAFDVLFIVSLATLAAEILLLAIFIVASILVEF